jgi:hypothetical protein
MARLISASRAVQCSSDSRIEFCQFQPSRAMWSCSTRTASASIGQLRCYLPVLIARPGEAHAPSPCSSPSWSGRADRHACAPRRRRACTDRATSVANALRHQRTPTRVIPDSPWSRRALQAPAAVRPDGSAVSPCTTTNDGASMEPSGCNRWQSVAKCRRPKTAQTSEIRCRGLPALAAEAPC